MLAARLPSTSRQPGRPFPAIECNGLAFAKQVVEQSDAIAAFTLPSAAEELKRGRLVVLGTEPWSYAHYAIVSLKGQAPTAAAVRLRRCLRDAEAALTRVESRLVRTLLPQRQAATAS